MAKEKFYSRIETVKSFLSGASEWHAFLLGFASWLLTSLYLPGGRVIVVGVALAAEGAELGKYGLQKLGGNVVDPANIPDDIRKEPHYFVGGIMLAAALLAAYSLLL